ncbi:uncharacterized protein LOC143458941 [Clavelina lepadiformis]|uniref:uncharacterized protein LOC143458941 n=1 Tax=Clavelina lepadiformis TaxID=159417 RepID=UPI00404259D1
MNIPSPTHLNVTFIAESRNDELVDPLSTEYPIYESISVQTTNKHTAAKYQKDNNDARVDEYDVYEEPEGISGSEKQCQKDSTINPVDSVYDDEIVTTSVMNGRAAVAITIASAIAKP